MVTSMKDSGLTARSVVLEVTQQAIMVNTKAISSITWSKVPVKKYFPRGTVTKDPFLMDKWRGEVS
jgi:hypothetical protein